MTAAQPPRGMRDIAPADMRRKAHVLAVLRQVFEEFAFEPMDTPALEYRTTLMGKYGPDAERLIYSAGLGTDHDLALRYDLSVPLARFSATTNVATPFKRYQIAKVWRGDRPQRGRYREITQADVDIVGSPSLLADAEIITVIATALRRLGFTATVTKINNRKVLFAIGQYAGVPEDLLPGLYRSIDKLDKIGLDGVRLELSSVGLPGPLLQTMRQGADRWLRGTASPDVLLADLLAGADRPSAIDACARYMAVLADYPHGVGTDQLADARSRAVGAAVAHMRADTGRGVIGDEAIARLLQLIAGEPGPGRLDDLAATLKGPDATSGLDEIRAVVDALAAAGLSADQVVFDPAMVRGLEYYTGTIFETVVTDPPVGSITGGGRYDDLTKLFGRALPAVGTSLGVDRLIDVMTEHDLFPPAVARPHTQILVTRFDEAGIADGIALATEFREAGLRTEMYLERAGLADQIRHALKREVRLVAILGPEEAEAGTVALRDLAAGSQVSVPRGEAVERARAMLAAAD